ncbi:uncharacterized protein LY89DRAFT_678106 [Mollisia scopiformis]|uniref:BHLH domain-containing protein n=1 Tax=Mollisia scopiformis TaxID=149040 RepID=A0A132B574_MOLSC|nr:uncharacterized protein LY89DRAFT_678106 [Mollisia scopiformis]KUJ07139.1 hypothetical protein LY89DRAFT_678106 [Mollisia scopiformis]
MPNRNLSFQSSVSGSDLLKLRDLSCQEGNVFDKEFHADLDMKDWNEWMQCEGTINQLESPMIDRTQSIASTVSWLEGTSSANIDRAVEKDAAVFSSFLNDNEFSFEDALLEFDEVPPPPPPCYNLPMGIPTKDNNRASQDVPRKFRGFSSLTEAEERSLTDIAMPYHILAKNTTTKRKSPSSEEPTSPSAASASFSSPAPSPSPEPVTTRKSRTNKKRKSLVVVDDAESRNALCQSRKNGHNMIEKRYRTNLNEKIDCLRQSVPAFPRRSSSGAKSDGEEEEDEEGQEDSKIGRQKYGKAAILTRALEYIKHLENTTERLGGEVDLLKNRAGAFEKLAMSGSIVLSDRVGLVAGGLLVVKSETLESVRADFKQVGLKYRPLPGPNTRRRNSRQVKVDLL